VGSAHIKWGLRQVLTSISSSNTHHSSPATQKPRLIFWELTKGCNLRCIHCRASATELSSPNDLSTQAAQDIIDQIAAVSSPILVLSGGEPLFRKDIFQLAQYGTDKGLRVALATNGTLVTEEVAHKIVASGVKRVAISLDGIDAATHDRFRGIPGAFEETSKLSACLCKSTPRSPATTRISFLPCSNSQERLELTPCILSCWFRWVVE
jgi:MoaA/NifB/PqqE/SkfB family radical SAM enzyme